MYDVCTRVALHDRALSTRTVLRRGPLALVLCFLAPVRVLSPAARRIPCPHTENAMRPARLVPLFLVLLTSAAPVAASAGILFDSGYTAYYFRPTNWSVDVGD